MKIHYVTKIVIFLQLEIDLNAIFIENKKITVKCTIVIRKNCNNKMNLNVQLLKKN